MTSMGPATPEKCAGVSTWDSAATAVSTTSASASSEWTPSRRPARSLGDSPASRTRSSARARDRFTTTMLRGAAAGGMSQSARATPRPIAPAPTTTTRLSRNPSPLSWRATVTAAWANDVVPRAMPVSVRTRLPVCSACWKRAERTGPLTPSS